MILTTLCSCPGMRVKTVLGMVQGSTVRARDIGRDLTAFMKNVTGGEITEYTKLMAESREQCLDRMREEATRLGANAIIGVRFATSEMAKGASELLVYGTAVVVELEP